MSRQLVVIVNPHSGGGRGRRVGESCGPRFQALGFEPEVIVCRDPSQPVEIARRAAAAGVSMVVAVGGDGHAAAIAEGLIGGSTALALLPAGSANDYARSLGMPQRDLDRAVELISAGRVARVDTIAVTVGGAQRHFLNVVGTGFDAAAAATAERIPFLRGSRRYVLAIMRELPRFAPALFRVTIDGEQHEMRAMMIALANGTSYGGGMRVAPDARLDSGALEVCVVGDVGKLEFVRAFPRVFHGTHVDHPKVRMLTAHDIEIEADRPIGLLGDGDLAGQLPARIRVVPASLSVVIGAGHSLGPPISNAE